MKSFDANALASEIFSAYTEGGIIAPPSTRYEDFDLAAAYEVEAEFKKLRSRDSKPVGLKVGYANKAVWRAMKLVGTNCSPFEAWLTNNGIKTLALRMDRHCSNAQDLAEYFERHPAVERVNYPGLPSPAALLTNQLGGLACDLWNFGSG